MYFKRIEMQGFKSFAEPVTIELNDGITCIIGPNGSGKSNISDAISWVLGEQSPKMLRGGKMDEVIFAGTASRKSRGMAEVTLVIDNTKGLLPIDYNEVAITRRMYRSGESEYAINNSQCRLRDVRDLIMDTGIGVEGYSIIRQGKISDIISNKTESRREIFESAAGIVTYRNRKAETERKLASSNQQLERVNDIICEIETRIGTLQQESEKASEYLKLRERFKELEINITLRNIEKLETNTEAIIRELEVSTEEIKKIRERKETIDKEVNESREKNESLETLSEQASVKHLALIDEINTLAGRNRIDTEKLTNLAANAERLEQELQELSEKLQREEKNAEAQYALKAEAEKKLFGLKSELDKKVIEHAERTAAYASALAGIESEKNEIFTLLTSEANKRAEAASIGNLKSGLIKRKNQLLDEKTKAEAEIHNLTGNIEIITTGKGESESRLGEAKTRLSTIKLDQTDLMVKDRQANKEIEQLKVELGRLLSRKKTIEEMEANYEGYNNAVKYIMKSGLRGLHGTVADLIKVPAGFEVAIETALGGSIQNIVCETDQDAGEAINALKENRAGRLTFLPVSSIRADGFSKDKGLLGSQGVKGFAVDRIDFEETYRNVMEYLLGRVVIVDSMNHAVRLSKESKGLRFVTLEGEFINANGAITGGRHKNNSGNLLERKAEIDTLEIKINENKAILSKMEEDLDFTKELLKSSLETQSELELEIRDIEIEVHTKKTQIESMKESLSSIESLQTARDRELRNIEAETVHSTEMEEALIAQAKEVSERAGKIEREIEQALTLHENQKQKIEDLSEEITKSRMAASSCESGKQGIDTLIAMINRSIADMRAEKTLKERLLETYRSEKKQILEGSGAFTDQIKQKENDKQKIENYINELKEEKASVFARFNKATLEKEKLDDRLEVLSAMRLDLEIRRGKNETLIETYKEKIWDDFEISYVHALELKKKEFIISNALKEDKEIRNMMKELGEVNIGAIAEYSQVRQRYEFLTGQRTDILEAVSTLKKIIDDTDKIIRERFKQSFEEVSANFERFFKELFGGGNAKLLLEDGERPLDSDIEIVAQPPGKKLSNISLLSGGEKTMTAIALMFAVLKTKPTPFCILDEIEASLDESNINRFIKTLKNFGEDIQFALVTHQKATMEHADSLYGVTMAEQGISKVISLKLGDEFDLGENKWN